MEKHPEDSRNNLEMESESCLWSQIKKFLIRLGH